MIVMTLGMHSVDLDFIDLLQRKTRKYRRSLYFMSNLRKGDVVQPGDIRAIRPGFGLSPKHFDTVVGKVVCCDVERGDPVTLEVIES